MLDGVLPLKEGISLVVEQFAENLQTTNKPTEAKTAKDHNPNQIITGHGKGLYRLNAREILKRNQLPIFNAFYKLIW